MDGFNESLVEVGTIAATATSSVWIFFGNFLGLIILTLILFFIGMRRGSSGLISLNLALYIAYAVYAVFPYRDAVIGIGATPLIQAIISLGIFIIATVPPFVMIERVTSQSFGSLSIIQNLFLSFGAAVFLMALGYHVFDISNIYTFSEPLNQLFVPEGYFFYWFIAPLIGLFFFAR